MNRDAVFDTEVGRAYLAVANISEATLTPAHAIDIAQWAVEYRHPLRRAWDLLTRGHTRTWWQAQALREHLTRMTCPTCDGAGIVDTSPPGVEHTAPWLLTDTDCPRCDGTGEIDPTTYEPDIEES